MSYYSVNRDDSELRIVVCPKCSTIEKRQPNVTKYDDYILYTTEGYALKLMQCNVCNTYFTFYREDGLREIPKELAEKALEKGYCDMQKDGRDQHGHGFYIIFKEKPFTIDMDTYSKFMYESNDDTFCSVIKKSIPSILTLIKYRNLLSNIDFDSMPYLANYPKTIEGFVQEIISEKSIDEKGQMS